MSDTPTKIVKIAALLYLCLWAIRKWRTRVELKKTWRHHP